jgi:hypothetical protein
MDKRIIVFGLSLSCPSTKQISSSSCHDQIFGWDSGQKLSRIDGGSQPRNHGSANDIGIIVLLQNDTDGGRHYSTPDAFVGFGPIAERVVRDRVDNDGDIIRVICQMTMSVHCC